MKRKTVPIRTVLTNRRDNESDLGGVQLVERKASDDGVTRPKPVDVKAAK
jgi:hypothetical protein